ncbi:MAG TPA: Fe-S cluster assembly ATPase SufC [Acidimicrobiales bacterium]|nr:Fe-S cluster assembly ATPase SufC [Acidimicrobiales bacterium]
MSVLRVEGLRAEVATREILRGVDLEVHSGQVHAVMGPNGSGKSTLAHVLMGRPGYRVTAGSVTIDGVELLEQPTWRRAQAGLFLALQYPVEVPGVGLADALEAALAARPATGGNGSGDGTAPGHQGAPATVGARLAEEAARVGQSEAMLSRGINVDMSGGEKKRFETVQLGVLRPRFAVLDEIDSGLDVDALRLVSRRVAAATTEFGLGVLAITHYSRLLTELVPSTVHVLAQGRIVATGGPELATELERTGYVGYGGEPDAG